MKTNLITGITGQDGAYLARRLLDNGEHVVGIVRSLNSLSPLKLQYLGIESRITYEECDLQDMSALSRLFEKHQPGVIYHLAAQSAVSLSFDQPIGTMTFNILSTLNLLETIRRYDRSIRFYQASSSEMFGKVQNLPVTETTPMHPRSPYAVSKASSHWTAINYRESYGMFVSCGILFNHESHLRPRNFFIKKVIAESLLIAAGKQDLLKVGNLDIRRDFGYAPRYVEAMHLMMQQSSPDDFLICSGRSVSLREIVGHVFQRLSIDLSKLAVDKSLYRPVDIEDMYGSNSKARSRLNWHYDTDFMEVLDLLIREEQAALQMT
ncbi:MAG: GDP-mannose 4,6-dehydratase [Verrucomicrobiae bacterium]|nr:GDP-mannose 4,6-dehydratase [Verrucomicrobiae bacterium]